MNSSPIPVFQYWHKPRPPGEVADLMQSWSGDPAYRYEKYDRKSAQRYIARHFGFRVYAAFNESRIPAMQADLFRYCKLYRDGGLYADADTKNLGSLADLISQTGRNIIMRRGTNIPNALLYFHEKRDPLLGLVLDIAVSNIEARISNDVWAATGPGIITKMYRKDPDVLKGFHIEEQADMAKLVGFPGGLKYKTGAKDWRQFRENGVSVYKRDNLRGPTQRLKYYVSRLT